MPVHYEKIIGWNKLTYSRLKYIFFICVIQDGIFYTFPAFWELSQTNKEDCFC